MLQLRQRVLPWELACLGRWLNACACLATAWGPRGRCGHTGQGRETGKLDVPYAVARLLHQLRGLARLYKVAQLLRNDGWPLQSV